MSQTYPGGIISKTAPTTTGGVSGVAPGIWTMDQAMQLQMAGTWPRPPYLQPLFSWGTGASGELGSGDLIARSSPGGRGVRALTSVELGLKFASGAFLYL